MSILVPLTLWGIAILTAIWAGWSLYQFTHHS